MPGFHIHVAIGDKYKIKNKILKVLDFDKGTVYPDLVKDKAISHYTGKQDGDNLLDYLENKVNLAEFLKNNDINSDYNKGVFLHLVTDYLFFNYFLDKNYLKRVDYDSFCKDLYYSYDLTNDYIFEKYKISFSVYKKEMEESIAKSRAEKNMDDKKYLNLLPKEKLDYFIEVMSNINLEKYAEKIKEVGYNVLPKELEIHDLIKILWDYMFLGQEIKKCDCILGLGCNDLLVPKRCAALYNEGYADIIIFTGAKGKSTFDWNISEAEKFRDIAVSLGVPKDKILIEDKATNTGDNFKFVQQLIEEKNLDINSFLIVQKPYMERRCYAVFKKIFPDKEGCVTSSQVSFEQYYLDYKENNGSCEEFFNIIVGDVLRMKYYADRGWQIKQDIPEEVWNACLKLLDYGYNKYEITD